MIKEMTAEELDSQCRTYVSLSTANNERAVSALSRRFYKIKEENGYVRVYDDVKPEEVVSYLYEYGITVSEIFTSKVNLEEYYTDLMKERRA